MTAAGQGAKPRAKPAASPRPSASPRPAAPRPRRKPAAAASVALPAWKRWMWVALLVLGAVVGLPLAHALAGDVMALLLAALLLGFLVGRWTGGGRA